MDRKIRTEILIKSGYDFCKEYADKIEKENKITLISKPQNSLVMIKVKESPKNTNFYLGEVLVSECKVAINDEIGLGVITEINLEFAKSLAIIDAAYKVELPIILDINIALLKNKTRIDENENIEIKNILKTKVEFELMD